MHFEHNQPNFEHTLTLIYNTYCIQGVVLEYVLPHCDYQPMYAYKHKVLRYKGYLEVQQAAVFPDDHTLYKHDKKWSQGNPQIDAKVQSLR